MLTLYQTTATFVPGARPPYVVDASISIRLVCCNPTLVGPSSPLQHIIRDCTVVFVEIFSPLLPHKHMYQYRCFHCM